MLHRRITLRLPTSSASFRFSAASASWDQPWLNLNSCTFEKRHLDPSRWGLQILCKILREAISSLAKHILKAQHLDIPTIELPAAKAATGAFFERPLQGAHCAVHTAMNSSKSSRLLDQKKTRKLRPRLPPTKKREEASQQVQCFKTWSPEARYISM